MFYPEIIFNRSVAEELLESDSADFRLSESDFVFSHHQGYQFMYFSTGVSDDPPVYYYIEGTKSPEKKYDSFSKFLSKAADDYVRITQPR